MFDVTTIEPSTLVTITFDTPLMAQASRVQVLTSNCGYDLARAYDDILVKHKNIYSSLVGKPVDNIHAAKFLLYRGADNKVIPVADCWIRDIKVIESLDVRFKVRLDNRQEIAVLTKALAGYGLSDVEFEIIENGK